MRWENIGDRCMHALSASRYSSRSIAPGALSTIYSRIMTAGTSGRGEKTVLTPAPRECSETRRGEKLRGNRKCARWKIEEANEKKETARWITLWAIYIDRFRRWKHDLSKVSAMFYWKYFTIGEYGNGKYFSRLSMPSSRAPVCVRSRSKAEHIATEKKMDFNLCSSPGEIERKKKM